MSLTSLILDYARCILRRQIAADAPVERDPLNTGDSVDMVRGRCVYSRRLSGGRWMATIEGLPNKVFANSERELFRSVCNVIAAREVKGLIQ